MRIFGAFFSLLLNPMSKKLVLMVQDESGEILSQSEYALRSDADNLTKIEIEVETLRSQVLSDLTKNLLQQEQTAHEKKRL